MRTTRILSLSLPPDLIREAERVAKQEGRTQSELFREALRRYVEERRWRGLQRYGSSRAGRLGMTEASVERAVQGFRRGRRGPCAGSRPRDRGLHLAPDARRDRGCSAAEVQVDGAACPRSNASHSQLRRRGDS